jgi:hypothetical protein
MIKTSVYVHTLFIIDTYFIALFNLILQVYGSLLA